MKLKPVKFSKFKSKIPVVVICHKGDFFLAKICVASIRYYYPEVEIYIIKDKINGDFSLKELQKYFGVKNLVLEKEIFGWGMAKIFLLLQPGLPFRKYLILDADTVFAGKILDRLAEKISDYDFVVNPECRKKPGSRLFTKFCYRFDWVKKRWPDFQYPGYEFNVGCFVVSQGIIEKKDLSPFFDKENFPYIKEEYRKILPLQDQSLLNIVLARLTQFKRTTVGQDRFMLWSGSKKMNRFSLDDVKVGKKPMIIHWAGALKVEHLDSMVRGDVLRFFQKYYYSKLPLGLLRYYLNYVYYYPVVVKARDSFDYHLKNFVLWKN